VGAIIFEKGKVLLSKRAGRPFKNYWDVPGGFLEAGEHPEEGIKREIFEETGLKIKPMRIIGVFMDTYGKGGIRTLNIHFEADLVGVRNQ